MWATKAERVIQRTVFLVNGASCLHLKTAVTMYQAYTSEAH